MLTSSQYIHTVKTGIEEAFKWAFRHSQHVSLCLASSRQEFNKSGVSLSVGNLPAKTCHEHICSESPLAHQVWSAAQSAAAWAVIVHAAPHPGSQCFTFLIQRETFSQLPRLPSLCFATDKKKRGNQWNQGSIALLHCQAHAPSKKKNELKFNSENSCHSPTLILSTNCCHLL